MKLVLDIPKVTVDYDEKLAAALIDGAHAHGFGADGKLLLDAAW